MLFDGYVRSTYVDKFGDRPSSVEDAWIKLEARFNQGLNPNNLTEKERKDGEDFFRGNILANIGWA